MVIVSNEDSEDLINKKRKRRYIDNQSFGGSTSKGGATIKQMSKRSPIFKKELEEGSIGQDIMSQIHATSMTTRSRMDSLKPKKIKIMRLPQKTSEIVSSRNVNNVLNLEI